MIQSRFRVFIPVLLVFFYLLVGSPVSLQAFDLTHKKFDAVLKKHVKGGKVDYASLKASPGDLNEYLKALSSVSLIQFSQFSEKDQLAFLINAYNAFTLDLIIRNYPIKSIGDIGGPIRAVNLARGAPWKNFSFDLLGEKRNLDWVEHGKLRKDYKEPRIHFAINCASIGCPLLRPDAYTGRSLESQLQAATLGFLRERDKNFYDSKTNTLHISKIFEWFAEDFIKDSGSVLEFLRKSDPLSKDWGKNPKIRYTDYDWNLNGI